MEFNNENIERACSIMRLYLDNRYPREIEGEVIGWLAAEFNRPEKAIALGRIFEEYIRPDHSPDAHALKMYRRMARRLGFPDSQQMRPSLRPRPVLWRVAAVLVPVMVALGGFWMWNGGVFDRTPIQIAVTASGGVNEQVVLPDGSRVWLRSGSTISYPGTFPRGKKATRDVTLSGEAHFTVARVGTPFTVHAGQLKVRVLGTVFNLAAWEGEPTASVKLYSGSVEAHGSGGEITAMEPGHLLTYHAGTRETTLMKEDTSDPASWITGVLLIDNRTTKDIFRMLERHFGVEIDDGELASSELRHSARFDAEHSLDDALHVLQILTQEFDYHIDNDTVKITTKQ